MFGDVTTSSQWWARTATTRQVFCLFSTYNAVSIPFGKARAGRTGPSRIIASNSRLHCGADRVHLSKRGQCSVMIDRGDDHMHLGPSGPSDRRTGHWSAALGVDRIKPRF